MKRTILAAPTLVPLAPLAPLALVALALSLGGCGGGEAKPAKGPDDPSLATTSTPTGAHGTTPPSDKPAASTSSDVTKGIEAMQGGDDNGAKALFDIAIQKNPKQADAYYYLGVVDEKLGDKDGAEKAYKGAIASDPSLQEAAVNLVAIYTESKRYDDAISVAKGALAKNPKNAELELDYAVVLGMKGDQAASEKAFDEAVKLKSDARTFMEYGHALASWKRNDDAVAKLKLAMNVAPDDPGMLASIAFELRVAGDPHDCIPLLDKAIKLKDAAELRTYRALCKLGVRDKPGALGDLQDAVAKDPKYAVAHYHLGGALADSGKLKEGIAEWQKYIELDKDGPMVKAAQAHIERAKKKLASGGK